MLVIRGGVVAEGIQLAFCFVVEDGLVIATETATEVATVSQTALVTMLFKICQRAPESAPQFALEFFNLLDERLAPTRESRASFHRFDAMRLGLLPWRDLPLSCYSSLLHLLRLQ